MINTDNTTANQNGVYKAVRTFTMIDFKILIAFNYLHSVHPVLSIINSHIMLFPYNKLVNHNRSLLKSHDYSRPPIIFLTIFLIFRFIGDSKYFLSNFSKGTFLISMKKLSRCAGLATDL